MADVDDGLLTWGSHRPALIALARFFPIRSVIEFGAGVYSTRLFLDRAHFPLLESLISFENEKSWVEKVRTDDPRHTILIWQPTEFIRESTGMKADFVFIDSAGERFALTEHSLTLAPIFAMHDRRADEFTGMGFKYVRGFNSIVQTVFVSNTIDLAGIELE
jgi:hypothetical protein